MVSIRKIVPLIFQLTLIGASKQISVHLSIFVWFRPVIYWRHGFLDDVEINVVFILKISCFLFTRFWHLTLKGFRSSAYRCSSRKYKTFSFFQWFGGFSCAIQEKFTAWRTSSTSNFTWKTDIAFIASRFVRFRFLAWNLTWNSVVRQWIFLYN